MNYVNEQNMQEILEGIARKIGQGGGTGSGLEDWQAEHEYIEKDICVYEGQIYRAKVGFTSDTTFSTTQILEEYEPVGGETIIPYEKDTEISIDDIVSYDNNTYKALYNFVCGEEFSLYALEEYVPQELTDVQEQEIINHFMPNIYSGGNMSIEDSTPIGTIISFMGTIAPENYLVCDGQIYNIADYIELAEFIKTQFGSYDYFGGDGVSTFAVPDLQGEFLRMTGTNSHTNQGNGANVGVHQDATKQNIIVVGSITDKVLQVRGVDGSTYEQIDNTNRDNVTTTNKQVNFASASMTSGPASADGFYTARPTNTSVLYCIKYKMSITNAEEIKDLTTEDIKQIVSAYNPVFEEAKGVEYSTEERRIGTWIDGKPLYQKTFSVSFNDIEVGGRVCIPILSLEGLYDIKECNGYLDITSDNIGHYLLPNVYVAGGGSTNIAMCQPVTGSSTFSCLLVNYYSSSALSGNIIVTIKYTKTTD